MQVRACITYARQITDTWLAHHVTSAVVIGKYYHTSSAPKIVKARWHPLGFQRTSLVLLTIDGLLREYDVIGNPDEPLQECTCIPPVRSQPVSDLACTCRQLLI